MQTKCGISCKSWINYKQPESRTLETKTWVLVVAHVSCQYTSMASAPHLEACRQYSTVETKEPLEITMEDVIDGWKEALLMMKTGDKWRLVIPPALAYGEQGYGPVPPSAVLVFDLELLDVPK